MILQLFIQGQSCGTNWVSAPSNFVEDALEASSLPEKRSSISWHSSCGSTPRPSMVVAGGPQSGRQRDQGFLRGFGVCEILLERGLAMASGMLRCAHLALSSRVQGLAHFNRGARGNSDGSLASERATQFSKLSLPRSPSPVVPFPEVCLGVSVIS